MSQTIQVYSASGSLFATVPYDESTTYADVLRKLDIPHPSGVPNPLPRRVTMLNKLIMKDEDDEKVNMNDKVSLSNVTLIPKFKFGMVSSVFPDNWSVPEYITSLKTPAPVRQVICENINTDNLSLTRIDINTGVIHAPLVFPEGVKRVYVNCVINGCYIHFPESIEKISIQPTHCYNGAIARHSKFPNLKFIKFSNILSGSPFHGSFPGKTLNHMIDLEFFCCKKLAEIRQEPHMTSVLDELLTFARTIKITNCGDIRMLNSFNKNLEKIHISDSKIQAFPSKFPENCERIVISNKASLGSTHDRPLLHTGGIYKFINLYSFLTFDPMPSTLKHLQIEKAFGGMKLDLTNTVLKKLILKSCKLEIAGSFPSTLKSIKLEDVNLVGEFPTEFPPKLNDLKWDVQYNSILENIFSNNKLKNLCIRSDSYLEIASTGNINEKKLESIEFNVRNQLIKKSKTSSEIASIPIQVTVSFTLKKLKRMRKKFPKVEIGDLIKITLRMMYDA